jgi:hypothetical protein
MGKITAIPKKINQDLPKENSFELKPDGSLEATGVVITNGVVTGVVNTPPDDATLDVEGKITIDPPIESSNEDESEEVKEEVKKKYNPLDPTSYTDELFEKIKIALLDPNFSKRGIKLVQVGRRLTLYQGNKSNIFGNIEAIETDEGIKHKTRIYNSICLRLFKEHALTKDYFKEIL